MIAAVLALGLVAQQAPVTKSVDQQKALIAKIQAERAAKDAKLAASPARKPAVRPSTAPEPEFESLGDPPATPKAASRKARYRAYQRRFEAEQAEIAKQEREMAVKMAPIIAEEARRQQQMQMRLYETELRHRENMDFNDALRGVTRGRP